MESSPRPGDHGALPPDPWANQRLNGPVPNTLVWALRAGIASVVCGLLTIALAGWSLSDDEIAQLRTQLGDEGVRVSADQLQNMSSTVTTLTLLFAAGLSALWLWLLHRAYWRRNWARITLTVLGAIWLLSSLPSLTGSAGGDASTVLLNLVQVILLVIVLVGLHTTASRAYFGRT